MITKLIRNAWRDYRLGRLIREKGISVMRIEGQLSDWSACDKQMDEMLGHNGKWTNGQTPLEAVSKIVSTK